MQKKSFTKNWPFPVFLDNLFKMKLGSLKSSSRDGELVVISKDNRKMTSAKRVAENLRLAIENWSEICPVLENLYKKLNSGELAGEPVKEEAFLSPLPRSFQWIDGSAFIQHIKLVRKSRKAPLPETLMTVPLVYQGGSDSFLSPQENIPLIDFSHGLDFEGEVGVIVEDVPMGIDSQSALEKIILFVLINDISLRGLALEELKRGFGFVQSKPSSSFAPFAVTEEELVPHWREGRIHLPLEVNFNGQFFGKANAGAMHFHFGELISHAAKTRRLTAGTIIGSGTVSNEDLTKGSSCLVEKRTLETIQSGKPKQPFMKEGDHIEIKVQNEKGDNIFGTISQKTVKI